MIQPENAKLTVMLHLNFIKIHLPINAYKHVLQYQICTTIHLLWDVNNVVLMDGLLMTEPENVYKFVHQLLHFSVTLILLDVLINVLKEDISSLQIPRDLVAHTVQFLIWEIYMLIIQHGLVLAYVLKNKAFIVLNTLMTQQFENVWELVL